MNARSQPLLPTPQTSSPQAHAASLPTFLDHIYELRRRLFWVVGFVIIASAAAFPVQGHIINILTAPLAGQKLYYITPVGGFSFIIKLCTYVGMAAAIPVLVYHLYRYVEPLMGRLKKPVLHYVFISSGLALMGMFFAYFVSLPAALHFLTSVNIGNIQAMLTVDSYLSFVMTYLLGAAILFQIPLILSIINGVTPLPPKKLMGFLRYVILGAFVVAAIISPTPDIINQAILAVPVIMMYQVGVLVVWLQGKRNRSYEPAKQEEFDFEGLDLDLEALNQNPAPGVVEPPPPPSYAPLIVKKPQVARGLDGFMVAGRAGAAVEPQLPATATFARSTRRSSAVPARTIQVPSRSVDGIVRRERPSLASS